MDQFQADVLAIKNIKAIPKMLEVICRTTGMGFAAVARVTEDRWIACCVRDEIKFGLKAGEELEIKTTLCDEIRQHHKAIIIDHVAQDKTYCLHPTPRMYGFQSYISIPIILSNGQFFGTLCAINPNPVQISAPEITNMFMLFTELIVFHLNAIDQLALSEARLQAERQTSALREQFIAVLGHDLRNPLSAISVGASHLIKMTSNERLFKLGNLMQASIARMLELIDNVMDFARSRLGGGIILDKNDNEPLAPVLRHVIAELQASWPDRIIKAQFNLIDPIYCDRKRIAQLFSNLLSNALTYGTVEQAVEVYAISNKQTFELMVSNAGIPIPAAIIERLFQPFYRGEGKANQKGLGLGLYIASEIARAHGGTLEVISTPKETRFTLRLSFTTA